MITLTVGMLWFGLQLQGRVRLGPNTRPEDKRKRESIIQRINSVLVICCASFSLRLAALGVLAYGTIQETSTVNVWGNLEWFIISNWVPFLTPVSEYIVIEKTFLS
jgi:hypothetical protein